MAMSHAHLLLLLLLLLSLFLFPTLLAINFFDCGDGSSPIEVTDVDIVRDKNKASFKISGSTSKSISGGYMEVTIKIGLIPIVKKTYNICEYTTCPVAPSVFVLLSDKYFPAHSSLRFAVKVDVFDDSDDEEIMCLTFDIRTSDSVAVSA